MQKILCIGTEWFSKNGGLSTFNRLLCITLAKTHTVFCYVPNFSSEEYEDAISKNVHLIKPKHIAGMGAIALLNNKPTIPNNEDIDIIIGHDKVTGPNMLAISGNYYHKAHKVFFIHTVPGEIEWLKPEQSNENPAGKAEEKESIQKELAKASDLIVAVGPKLHLEIQASMAGVSKKPKIIRFDPGLFQEEKEINYEFESPIFEVLMMGRMEDFHLKGVDIAFKAMDLVYRGWSITTNNIVIKPRIIIRGAAVGAEKALVSNFKNLVPDSNLVPYIKNYSADVNVIIEDIRKSTLVLMPSRAEGFGLVALEALSLGRQILISENSGLAMLLREIAPTESHHWIIPGDIPNSGIEKWAEKINIILSDRIAASNRLKLLTEIYSKGVSWNGSVHNLIKEIEKLNSLHVTSNAVVNYEKEEQNLDLGSSEIKQLLQMQPGTKLFNAFFALPLYKRYKIAEELELINPEDKLENNNSDKLCSVFLQRAYEKNILAKLWDKLFQDTNEQNPFKN